MTAAGPVDHPRRPRPAAAPRPRTDTELGRTAAAFDDMLDELEGAEAAGPARPRRGPGASSPTPRTSCAPRWPGCRRRSRPRWRTRPAAGPSGSGCSLLLLRETAAAGPAGRRPARAGPHRRRASSCTASRSTCWSWPAPRPTAWRGPAPVEVGAPVPVLDVRPAPASARCWATCSTTPRAGTARPAAGSTVGRVGGRPGATCPTTGPACRSADRERIFDRLVRLDEARAPSTAARAWGCRSPAASPGRTAARSAANPRPGARTSGSGCR